MPTISSAFGDNLTIKGFVVDFLTALTTSLATSVFIPKAIPPCFTLGQDIFNSIISKSPDRKSTRLNSSHANISYAVFCLKKKKNTDTYIRLDVMSHGATALGH